MKQTRRWAILLFCVSATMALVNVAGTVCFGLSPLSTAVMTALNGLRNIGVVALILLGCSYLPEIVEWWGKNL